MLLREKEPTPELVDSLADAKLSFFVCGHCGQSGLQREDDPEQDHGWPEAKPCRGCSARIPVERLELFPNTQYCAQCQATIDRGETPEAEREFCSRCGEVLRHRARQRGIATYELYCPACGRS